MSTALQADGHFTLDAAALATLAGGTLADGAHVLRLAAIDAAGNRTQTEVAFTLDTLAPDVPTLGLDAASDSGASASDGITADSTPTLQIGAGSGATLRLLREGVDAGAVLAGLGAVGRLVQHGHRLVRRAVEHEADAGRVDGALHDIDEAADALQPSA